jgi:phosphoribosyl 1,2-cyclic phosphodiesterase
VSGSDYLDYGGDTTCLELRSCNDDILIVDCGSGIRRLGNLLLAEKRHELNILFTHAHWDHISGFPFFKPIYRDDTNIAIFGCIYAQKSIKTILANIMEPPFFPVDLSSVKAHISFSDTCGLPLDIGSIHVEPIPLSHPNQGFGYSFSENNRKFVFLTDNELEYQHPGGGVFQDYLDFCRGADLLIHDAEYTDAEYRQYSRSWGHSRYRKALELAMLAGVGRFGLFHHNQERSDTALDEILQDCRCIVAEQGSPLECFVLTQDTQLDL